MDFEKEPKVKRWREKATSAGFTVRSLEPLLLLPKHNQELLAGVFSVDAQDAAGRRLLRYILIRGDAVVIVPLLRNKKTGVEQFCMIRQVRNGNARENLEFPAGLLDRDVDDPRGVAVRELREETGLVVDAAALQPLHNCPLYTSVGLDDEAVHFYGCVVELDDPQFRAFEGRPAGEADEHEVITVTLRTRQEAEPEILSLQVLMGFVLFDRWRSKKEGAV